MNMKTINVRELQRNMKTVAAAVARGQHFIVLKNARPVFEIWPTVERRKKQSKTIFDAFKHIQFRSKEKNLSQKIDDIVYQEKR
jgi:antitoxin (DNA-binding transcriptional repressor) of toxin-antitoxin stability system